nr:ABC transporter substrate-binding protein [uncultured Holophaga sp.]
MEESGLSRQGRTALCAVALSLLAACGRSPIPVGFAGQMTGRQAELGVQERNGAQMAIDACNRAGGIGGHPVRLLALDDAGLPAQAREVDRRLIGEKVVAIIGHCTSGQTLAGLEVTTPAGVPLIGPTVSTPDLSGRDDLFFRVYPSFGESARIFARHIRQQVPQGSLGVLLDEDNAGYTQTYAAAFRSAYRAAGGGPLELSGFSAASQPAFGPLLTELRRKGTRALLIIASDNDTALIAQQARLQGWRVPLFAAAWAQTSTLIQSGGRAVEGLQLEQSFAPDRATPRYGAFAEAYEVRFGQPPSFGAAFGFEAAQVLLAALVRTGGRREGLKEALLATRDFPGLLDTFSLDRFGDVSRPFYLSEIREGRFVVIGKLSPDR